MRENGAIVSTTFVRALVLGLVTEKRPDVFTGEKPFKCTYSFIYKLLRSFHLSYRVATRAASKVPEDWDRQGYLLALRLCHSIKVEETPPQLLINADQTGINYLLQGNKTWHPQGDKQVAIIGEEEKRQFTLMVAFSAAGDLLPFQAIYSGKTETSLPSSQLRKNAEPIQFDMSGGTKHWSNLNCMKLVSHRYKTVQTLTSMSHSGWNMSLYHTSKNKSVS
jgi:hypothetical protein